MTGDGSWGTQSLTAVPSQPLAVTAPSSWAGMALGISEAEQDQIVAEAVDALQRQGLPLNLLRDTAQLAAKAQPVVVSAVTRRGQVVSPALQSALIQRVVAQVGGLGFLNGLIPARNFDPGYSEIALTPDGGVWVLRKGAQDFEQLTLRPSAAEVWRAVESLLAPLGRSVSEATPSVDAKLPRSEGMGGARVKILHPLLTPGQGYPSINVRLFEARPVRPEQLVEWRVAPPAVIQTLVETVSRQARLLVIGGTGTGKTTFLSALASGIPKQARVVKIEDPEEIWLDHPHVVTIEARPALPGSTVPAYTLKNGVDDAMRMSPRWLILGEVRTGDAAMSLFRAQMSDHPGLSTFHAESPEHAVSRMGVIMEADVKVDPNTLKAIFVEAIDLVVQVGWLDGRRQMLGAWEVEHRMQDNQVRFRQLYRPGEVAMQPMERR